MDELLTLTEGMEIPYGGNRVTTVPAELATSYVAGDRLVVVQDSGDLLHIPKAEWDVASGAVERAAQAFSAMGAVTDAQVTDFYLTFANALEDDASFGPIAEANAEDVERATDLGRSTTRLVLSDRMRQDMIDGLRSWAERDGGRGTVVETVHHTGWTVELIRSGLGVVGFVFEGRPNVFADATGVLRAGNTVVFRIGSDALGTARAIVRHALDPALTESGLPVGAATLVDSPSRAAGWAMFSDPRLSLAVARGSGPAVPSWERWHARRASPSACTGPAGRGSSGTTDADADVFSPPSSTPSIARSATRSTPAPSSSRPPSGSSRCSSMRCSVLRRSVAPHRNSMSPPALVA
jgi:glutamate-5-semialdehyde dehydrogenase